MQLSLDQINLLRHTLGNESMYRNYFANGSASEYTNDLDGLVGKGLMTVRRAEDWPSWCNQYDIYKCTNKGKEIAFGLTNPASGI